MAYKRIFVDFVIWPSFLLFRGGGGGGGGREEQFYLNRFHWNINEFEVNVERSIIVLKFLT